MRQCFFCEKAADSLEHLWPQWILGRVKPRGPLQHSIADSPVKSLGTPEMKMKRVCTPCNNGWMHDLEQESIPVLGALLQDIATPLDAQQQTTLALWSIKTAMVVEAVKSGDNRYFSQPERNGLRLDRAIPSHTTMWLGRYARSSIGAYGTDFGFIIAEGPVPSVGSGTTIIVGHLAVQVLALRIPDEFSESRISISSRLGQWEKLLVQIWPVQERIEWPPELSFRNSGPSSIAHLLNRWRIGEKVPNLAEKFSKRLPHPEVTRAMLRNF